MNRPKSLLVVASVLAAASVSLTGCVMPFGGGGTSTEQADVNPAGTRWAGTLDDDVFEMTLQPDGSIAFDVYNGQPNMSSDGDKWRVEGSDLVLDMVFEDESGNPFITTFKGRYSEDKMTLPATEYNVSVNLTRI